MSEVRDVVVIGGGLGGLTAALTCAKLGLDVVLFEQHYRVGGCASSFQRKEYNFEVSLHAHDGRAEENPLLKFFEVLPLIRPIQLKEWYRVQVDNIPGGGSIDFAMPTGWEAAEQAMMDAFPKAEAEIRSWFEFNELLAKGVIGMLGMAPQEPDSLQLLMEWGTKTLQEALDHFFKTHEDAKLAAGAPWSWFGQGPDIQSIAYFSFAYYHYIKEGAWQLYGGSQSLAKAYATRLKDAGATIQLKTPVEKVYVEQNQAQHVVLASGETVRSRYFVWNGSPSPLFRESLQGNPSSNVTEYGTTLAKVKGSLSFISLHLGIDGDVSDKLPEYERIWCPGKVSAASLRKNIEEGHPEATALIINNYTKLGDSWFAPSGKSNVIITMFDDVNRWPEWNTPQYKQKKKQAETRIWNFVKKKFGLDFGDQVEYLGMATPRTFERYLWTEGGTAYGYDATPDQVGPLRPAQQTPISNLWLAGQWTQPGHGFGAVQGSGFLAGKAICEAAGVWTNT